MKKIIITGVLGVAVSGSVVAATATACNGAGQATQITAVTGTTFIKSDLAPSCSANSLVNFDQNTSKLWAAAVSGKGASTFIGSTLGGAIKKSANCAANPCAQSDVTTGMTAAAALTGSN